MKIESYKNDIKDLPLWLKYALALFTLFGTVGPFLPIWVWLNDVPIQPTVYQTSCSATSTINILDVLSKNDSLGSAYDKQEFLKDYLGEKTCGVGSYVDFYKSGEVFRVLIDVQNHILSCGLSEYNSDIDLGKRLRLLKKGQEMTFFGKFTNSFSDGAYRIIDDCKWLK